MIIGLGNTASYMDSDSEVSDGMSDRYQNQLPYRLHLGHRQVALWAFVVGQDGEVSVGSLGNGNLWWDWVVKYLAGCQVGDNIIILMSARINCKHLSESDKPSLGSLITYTVIGSQHFVIEGRDIVYVYCSAGHNYGISKYNHVSNSVCYYQ